MTRRPRPRRPAGRALESITLELPDGRRALYVADQIRESDPPAVREGLARRRVLATSGRCPCGAESPLDPAVIPAALIMAAIVHADDCPAAETNLINALRGAGR